MNGPWAAVDFDETESGVWARDLMQIEGWMLRKDGKQPWAPWTDPDAPVTCSHQDHDEETTCAECGHSARYKWGSEGSSEHVHASSETALDWREKHPQARSDLVFIQRDDDPFAFVDGDDVRDPETGAVHPVFRALLDHLGLTYADVSTSGSGLHAYYCGELPIQGRDQVAFEIDTEPWGANETPPTVEIYANKHVNVATGEHVAGTPLEAAEWDEEALRSICRAKGFDDERVAERDTASDYVDLRAHTPAAVDADDVTEDVRDVLLAVDRLEPSDLPLRSRQTGSDSTGWTTWDPAYRSSDSGQSLHYNGEGAFHDHKFGESFGVLSLFAAERGVLTEPWNPLVGHDWWAAVDAARDAGAPIPRHEPAGRDSEHTAVLPPAVRDLTGATSGWDWKHAAEQQQAELTVDSARERTTEAIVDAYTSGDRVLIEALPTMGKSYGSIKAAAETGQRVTVLTGRGHKEQYEQLREWCDEHGLRYYVLPSFTRDCETANGEHGEEWEDLVRGWYDRGATPQEIHKAAEYVLGRPLPCQEHEGECCSYASLWGFDPENYDVLIGHYNHAHKPKVTNGRTVVFDEFPDAYETCLGTELQTAVSYFLCTTPGIPFDDYTDLIEHRDDESRRADAVRWFDDRGIEPDETDVFDDSSAHASAPLAVFTLLASEDLGNGFERADLGDTGLGVFDRTHGEVTILRPPNLTYASGIVALDGTPTKRMWELALGERLNHRPVLQDGERAEYVREALNLNLVRTTEYIKPYNSPGHVSTDKDAALLEAITEEHGERPSVITTSTAEQEYDTAGVLDHVDETKHYGNVLGSNEYDDTRVGAVIGSNHYGDGHIKKWAAYAGDSAERNEKKGAELSYGGFGDDVLQHMREHDTIQAAMRFGRDGNGAVVYVHTDTLPDWVPVVGEGRVLTTWSEGMKCVIRALEDLDQATTAEVVDHPCVDLSRQQVFDHLETLRARGVLTRQQDIEDGRRVVWFDDELHRLGEHGNVDLDPIELEDLDDDEVRQLARNTLYTWEFTNSAARIRDELYGPSVHGQDPISAAIDRGDRPPGTSD